MPGNESKEQWNLGYPMDIALYPPNLSIWPNMVFSFQFCRDHKQNMKDDWLIVGHILVRKCCFPSRRVKLILCEVLVKNLWQGKISLVKGGRRSQSPCVRTILHCISSELVSKHNLSALSLSLRKPHWGFLHWWSLLIHCGSLFTVTHL